MIYTVRPIQREWGQSWQVVRKDNTTGQERVVRTWITRHDADYTAKRLNEKEALLKDG